MSETIHSADFNGGYPEVLCSAKESPTFTCGFEDAQVVNCRACLRILAAREREYALHEAKVYREMARWGRG